MPLDYVSQSRSDAEEAVLDAWRKEFYKDITWEDVEVDGITPLLSPAEEEVGNLMDVDYSESDLSKGGAGSGEPPGHPFRGNQWTEGKSGGKRKVSHTSNIKDAVKRILNGESVELDSVASANTLVRALAMVALSAERQGKKAKNFNLCKVSVPGTNLFCEGNKGFSRLEMPQFSGIPVAGSEADKLPKDKKGEVNAADQFREFLKSKGVKVVKDSMPVSKLKSTQNELVGTKVAGMMSSKHTADRIFVSRDGYVIDGHHRWAAQVGRDLADGVLGDKNIEVFRVDLNISDVMKGAIEFTDSFGLARASGAVKKGDSPGHDFRGNQYVEGKGGRSAKTKAQKNREVNSLTDAQYKKYAGTPSSMSHDDAMVFAKKSASKTKKVGDSPVALKTRLTISDESSKEMGLVLRKYMMGAVKRFKDPQHRKYATARVKQMTSGVARPKGMSKKYGMDANDVRRYEIVLANIFAYGRKKFEI